MAPDARGLDWPAMRRTVLVIVLLGVLTAGCSLATASTDGGGFVAADGTTDIAAAEREPAPDVSGPTLDRSTLALSDLDRPVVIHFWASWGGPCAQEGPPLAASAERDADRGVQVVGVNVRDTRANAQSFEREYGISYPSWDDESASIASQCVSSSAR